MTELDLAQVSANELAASDFMPVEIPTSEVSSYLRAPEPRLSEKFATRAAKWGAHVQSKLFKSGMREPNEIDFWRGFALITIFINHIPGNFFERFTYRNLSLSDSAELFVFLAGWSLRLQTNRTASLPLGPLMQKLGGRALQVYFAQIVITEIAIALIAAASIYYDAPFLLDWHNAAAVFQKPVEATVGLIALTHQLGYFNILPLYVVLVASAPLIAICARYASSLLLPISAAIYIATLATGINLPSWPEPGDWFLNPLAWQFIYVLGFSLAGQDGIGGFVRRHRKAFFYAGLPIVALGIVIGLTHYSPRPDQVPNPKLFFVFDKTFLSPARLIDVLGLTAVFAGVFPFLIGKFGLIVRLLSLLGRHSLYVFCVASLLSLIGQIIRFAYGGAVLTDAMMVGTGLVVMGIVAWLSERRSDTRRLPADVRLSPSS